MVGYVIYKHFIFRVVYLLVSVDECMDISTFFERGKGFCGCVHGRLSPACYDVYTGERSYNHKPLSRALRSYNMF